MMKRIFIAIDIQNNAALTGLLNSFKLALKDERIRWVKPGNMHLTLAFLGDMDDKQVKKAGDIMQETAGKFAPFEIFFSGTGIFRNTKQPRVIWLGLEVPDALYRMQSMICERLEGEALYKNEKSFRPHITLGRMKFIENRDLLSDILNHPGSKDLPSQPVNGVVLYESILKPGGPEYYPLKRTSLLPSAP